MRGAPPPVAGLLARQVVRMELGSIARLRATWPPVLSLFGPAAPACVARFETAELRR